MFDREESRREQPYGAALDIGTGSGIWGVELAKRGWQVTGIDVVETPFRGRVGVSRLGDHARRAFSLPAPQSLR